MDIESSKEGHISTLIKSIATISQLLVILIYYCFIAMEGPAAPAAEPAARVPAVILSKWSRLRVLVSSPLLRRWRANHVVAAWSGVPREKRNSKSGMPALMTATSPKSTIPMGKWVSSRPGARWSWLSRRDATMSNRVLLIKYVKVRAGVRDLQGNQGRVITWITNQRVYCLFRIDPRNSEKVRNKRDK